ncbi:histone-lysine n-methyltransferase h3 lysine-9 specific suvh5 [Phtheirospermum japonicum]|uniref:Histone-lysine n-methyltransferase h3 lysine-9 specific suvh5 n=1 Tax=Phtheirospermum japonicum TaxID=374723 RepID=A0A830B870_9LAMI|nr:histone-lysine n-methyltransferase h3 lysine-9 specific suvh5 [Phtheirospermum japonicum]
MAEPNCPWRKGKKTVSLKTSTVAKTSIEKNEKLTISWRLKGKAVARKSTHQVEPSKSLSKKKKLKKVCTNDDVDENPSALKSAVGHKKQNFEVNLPPFGPNSSNQGDARNKVRNTLRVFNAICRKLLQQEESNSKPEEEGKSKRKKANRIDLLAAKAIKEKGQEVNTGKPILGDVPGVEVGDEFQYRTELAIVGIHRLYQAGIDSMKLSNDLLVATSIVSSGSYTDDLENADVLVYSGQGGNVVGKQKEKPQDQKLEKGNLALKNSIDAETPVRVIRGWKEKAIDPLDPKSKMFMTYVYDGLYTVKKYWTEKGSHGKQVFMFELRRNPGQPELAWKELKKTKKSKSRPGVCVTDISGGKEAFAICAVNTIDDDKPPPFNYISKMMYPEWYNPDPPAGCDCTGRCSDSRKCKCAVRNDGEIPYNRNGALVETKHLVYECGPHCKCPPSCYNRVSQRGIRLQLDIFKTESRGWGVRALTSIPSGSFICEYAGELLEDTEAERRIGNDEYLFDIGQNLSDSSMKPEDQALSAELVEDGGFTIDACRDGNIGRFINHSCSPNLYAQNVIYDHDDLKTPHIMLFAMENIPPLQELTYHYNYSVDQITDSSGNIKVKKCYCGTAQCTGRMY